MPQTATSYKPAFFAKIEEGSFLSARQVVPALISLLRPDSVVDIGCGTGAWLSVFRLLGIEDILGLDGHYVDRDALMIPQERFLTADLSKPVYLDRRFDLVISLEVAEHLPPESADIFVENLTSLGDVIAFSAAIPLQGGEHHVNEQWPEYWKKRFEARGYRLVDCLRHRFWNNRDVERWYRQNLFLYVKEARLNADPLLLEEAEKGGGAELLSIVHPAVFLAPSLSTLLRMLPGAIRSGIRRRLKR